MSDAETELSGPDLAQGIELSRISDGTIDPESRPKESQAGSTAKDAAK